MKTFTLFVAAALSCIPCLARAQSADERLRAIYTEEWKWRLEQFPGLEGVEKPVPDRLPKVDPATQEMRLKYWQDVLHKLDAVPRAQLSPDPPINYAVYRPEIENFVADEKFRDYEMPAKGRSGDTGDAAEILAGCAPQTRCCSPRATLAGPADQLRCLSAGDREFRRR